MSVVERARALGTQTKRTHLEKQMEALLDFYGEPMAAFVDLMKAAPLEDKKLLMIAFLEGLGEGPDWWIRDSKGEGILDDALYADIYRNTFGFTPAEAKEWTET